MEPDKLSIVIKSEGNWSQKLYRELSSQVDRLLVSVEGPYGSTSSNFLRLVYITIWITVLHLVSKYLYECGNLYNEGIWFFSGIVTLTNLFNQILL